MPNVIDSFTVEFGLDASKFTKGQKQVLDDLRRLQEQATSGTTNAENEGKRLFSFFSRLKAQAIGFFAALAGAKGVKEFVSYVTQLDASTGRAAKTLNMSTEAVSAWQGVMRQTGGSTEAATQALEGLSGQIQHFLLTGEGSFLPILSTMGISLYDANKNLKTTGQLFFDINRAVQGMDPAKAKSLMSALGLPPDVINTLLLGDKTLRSLYDEQVKLGLISRADADAAIELQKAWDQASTSATTLGRKITTILSPALIGALGIVTRFFKNLMNPDANYIAQSSAGEFSVLGTAAGDGSSGSPNGLVSEITSTLKKAAIEGYIREAAAKRGIDPDVAVAVAKSEGLGADWQSRVVRRDGSREPSYGPFQLFTGGGLGNKFQSQTGLDPRDPSTVKSQIDFALDEAKRSGWGAWHGWKGSPWAGLRYGAPGAAGLADGGSTSNTTSSQTTVGTINVTLPNARDAQGFARDVRPAMEQGNFAASANYGQQ